MKAAHHFAKSLTGNYSARLSFTMKAAYAISKMSREQASLYMAQNLPGYNFDSVLKSLNSKLSAFGAVVAEDFISLNRNTYEIKETLKAIGFKFNNCGRSWTIDCKSINDVISISNQLVA